MPVGRHRAQHQIEVRSAWGGLKQLELSPERGCEGARFYIMHMEIDERELKQFLLVGHIVGSMYVSLQVGEHVSKAIPTCFTDPINELRFV